MQNFLEPPKYTRDSFAELVGARNIYVWGCGLHGRTFALALMRNGFTVTAFLDRNADCMPNDYRGVKIIRPDELFNEYAADKPAEGRFARENFIICAAAPERLTQNLDMMSKITGMGMVAERDCFMVDALIGTRPYIDVAGGCNLRCIACPRGDTLNKGRMRNDGFMELDLYEKIVRKCLAENPFIPFIQLFAFGEPFLNPKLPEIVAINNRLMVGSHISTNLNAEHNIEEVIKQAPSVITISNSGFGSEHYEITHKGGKWNSFETNLRKLVEARARYNVDTKISVTYHLNTVNLDEYPKMYELCKELGINMSALAHSLFPDYVLALREGKPICEEAEYSKSLMNYPLESRLADAESEREKRCIAAPNIPRIHSDGSVWTCSAYMDEESKLADSYLDITLTELIDRKNKSSLCARCLKHSLHRYVWMELRPEYCERIIWERFGLPASL